MLGSSQLYAHMDHLTASSNVNIAGRAKHVSVNYRWKCSCVEIVPVKLVKGRGVY